MNLAVNFLFETVNITYISAILLVVRKKFNLDDRAFMLLFGHFIFIFLTNYVLFPPTYMGDQFSYLFSSQHLRGVESVFFHKSLRVQFASFLFAASPIPIINSVYSIALVNYLLYVTLYIFLRERRVLDKTNELFYLLYPSLALYTSLALRDTLIFFFMALLIYYVFVEKKIFIPILVFGIPLLLLKFQNFFVILAAIVLFVILHKRYHTLVKMVIILSILVIFYYYQSMFTLDNINKIRFLFYLENNTSFWGFRPFGSWSDALIIAFSSIFSYLFEPFIWKVKNPLHLIQSVENIIVFFMTVRIIMRSKHIHFKTERIALIFFLIVGLLAYSMVIINPGTAARYRYSFLGIFIIFYNYFSLNQTSFSVSDKILSRSTRTVHSL